MGQRVAPATGRKLAVTAGGAAPANSLESLGGTWLAKGSPMVRLRRGAGLAVVVAVTNGCMSVHTDEVRVRGAESRRVLGPEARDSALEAEFSYAAGVVQGSVRWSSNCREALMRSENIEVWHSKQPNYGAGAGALVAGAALALGSGALLANAPNYSDRPQSCDAEHCTSPREAAIGLGITGAIVSLVAVSAGLSTFAMKSERTRGESLPQPDALVAVTRRHVPCGRGAVAGIGVSLFRANERVAASVTNSDGRVALAVPADVSGELSVVVDGVPPEAARAREGEVIAEVAVPVTAADPSP